MLFNSKEFAVFLVLSFFLYWFVFNREIRTRNFFIVCISYVFYGWWDWRFLSLLFFSSALDHYLATRIYKAESKSVKKKILTISLVVNLGILCAFKYFNFFSDSFSGLLNQMGFTPDAFTLNVILPVGISFYTFQSLSYTIDVYYGKLKPADNLIQFLAYVAFFPQLVAGPIERATHLLPQFNELKKFNYDMAASGMRLMLWGFFKKSVVADQCAIQANKIFGSYEQQPTPVLMLGAVYFAFQIYGDFSGYSDIARGTSRLFGFDLMINFKTPYFARDIAEFWRRWHISLTTWFRDYLYIPLGGNRLGRNRAVINTLIVFLLSGLWHGANWTFVIWGLINALLFIPLIVSGRSKQHLDDVASGRLIPGLRDIIKMMTTFILVCFAWIFFRAENLGHALDYIASMVTNLTMPMKWQFVDRITLFVTFIMLGIDWITRERGVDAYLLTLSSPWKRRLVYAILFFGIYFFGVFNKGSFIYFQF